MTENRPHIIIRRLRVRAGTHIAYDQRFHDGINVIRGENSSGKSTILDFIFFVLGGDITIWKSAAALCTDVTAEVSITGEIVTLQREISPSRPSLCIYLGTMDESDAHRFKNWSVYPYAAKGESESFSKVLFRILGFPEVRSDQDNIITMHQVLRLAYVDQVSRKTSLMREHDWDTPLTRQIVADLLLGVYDDSLYADEQELRQLDLDFRAAEQQLIHNRDIVDAVEQGLTQEKLDNRIAKAAAALDEVNDRIDSALDEKLTVQDTSQGEIERLRKEIIRLNHKASSITSTIDELQVDEADSIRFVESLSEKVAAIDESLATQLAIGQLPSCPVCSVPLKHEHGITTCEFSGRRIKTDTPRTELLKVREEIRYQIQESQSLIRERQEKLATLAFEKEEVVAAIARATRTLKQKTSSVKSARDNRLNELYLEKGRLESDFSTTQKLGKYLEVLVRLEKHVASLRSAIGGLKERIRQKRGLQRARWARAIDDVGRNVAYILMNDFDRQREFQQYESLHLLFSKNTYLWNGRNNFSASSTVMVKNAIHFALLFASTADDQFRYPRFLLCDTIEEGGMERERSHHFQAFIAEAAKQAKQPFQIILAVASLSPVLDSSEYTVGPEYSAGRKVLDLPDELQLRATQPLLHEEFSGGEREQTS